MKFKEVPSTDRTTWLKWRHGGIGSSDASIIMGVSRFKTKQELIADKAGEFKGEDEDTFIKKRGNDIEKRVRAFLEQEYETTYEALSCENIEFPFRKATLDGVTPDRKTIVEIKLLSIFNEKKPNTQTAGYQKWINARETQTVPEEYYPQVQHQLDVTGADRCLFVGYRQIQGEYIIGWKDLAIVNVLPNRSYMKDLAMKEFEFWYEVRGGVNG